jgi:hypothetical protein
MWYNILAGGVYAETLQAENIILSAYPIRILRHQYMGGIFHTLKGGEYGKTENDWYD